MNDCQQNNVLHKNEAKNKTELCSIIFALGRLILSKYQAENTDFNYIAKLGCRLFAPFMKNNMSICCYFVSNIEPERQEKHAYDTILNICLLKKYLCCFLRYFLKYGRTMPLYHEMGIRICGDQKKEESNSNLIAFDSKNVRKENFKRTNNNLLYFIRLLDFEVFFNLQHKDLINHKE
ncbi:hypothetical protein EDEG_04106 [Edhazardia aedis USNM 41457]|uniref:Uncharacterized protein n=1 Tax=Edhazardia aedis (strain USNM 41457) TaxID=1003232 RepID=J8ZZW5_EDHAE|nr:hypothetical protein EDEG_04106 [Edhazardia aedis USNM 41457]|eukprot:EJW05183.1 hypothetical protein EDEG_04106 [Edhazardia aedis USNM 41457]